ncbi:uncharacterized protein ACNLHF_018586 isoform 2-T2 [Anomaloglossus baeobatrachus]
METDMMECPSWGVRRSDAIVTAHAPVVLLSAPGCVTPHAECFGGEDDGQSDISEASSEAWVASRSLYSEDEDQDMSPSSPFTTHEPEDWDAEILANENPYDEEDMADILEWRTGDQQCGSKNSYQPSVHHTPSIRCAASIMAHIEAGQFEDAEQ